MGALIVEDVPYTILQLREQEILEFIERRWGDTDGHWTSGNCYWFARILSDRFGLEIWYLPIQGHFVAGMRNNFYDIHGRIYPCEQPLLLREIQNLDPIWYDRLMRDCIL